MSGNRRMLGGRIHIGCIIAVVLVIIAGCMSLPYLTRTGTAMMLEQTAETLATNLKLPPQEREAVTEKFNTLAQKVRDGEVDLKQLENLSRLLAEGPLPTIVMVRVVETRYVEASTLPEEEKLASTTTLNRFAHGVILGDIPTSKADAIEEIMFEIPAEEEVEAEVKAEVEGDDKEATSVRDKKMKESMTDEDLAKLLGDMKAAADEAGIAEDVAKPDIAHVIQVAIDEIMIKPQPKEQTSVKLIPYNVINREEFQPYKVSFDILINGAANKEELAAISNHLKNQEKKHDKTFVCFYLPGMKVDAGAYATAHHTPDLNVKILDLQKEN